MSDSQSPRSSSTFWILLLLPAGFLVAWGAGRLFDSKPGHQPAAPETTVEAGVTPPGSATRPGTEAGGTTGSRGPGFAPTETEQRSPEPQQAELSSWTTLESAIAESRRNGKPVLIDFNAEWSGPCQRMKHDLFDDATFGRAVQAAVIPVSIVDRAREEGRNSPEIDQLQRQFGVDAFPTLVVFSPGTGKATRTQGFGGADRTLEWIQEAARTVR